MTFAHYDFKRGSSIHEHVHPQDPQEEVYEVIEGELEVTIDGAAAIARAGLVAIVRVMWPIRSRPSPMGGPLSLTIP
jgi:unsaturated pyranuronate lyase